MPLQANDAYASMSSVTMFNSANIKVAIGDGGRGEGGGGRGEGGLSLRNH